MTRIPVTQSSKYRYSVAELGEMTIYGLHEIEVSADI